MDGSSRSHPRDEIPEPVDDGAADHLPGRPVPSVELQATDGRAVDLSKLVGRIVVYCFPKMGRTPDEPDPEGWASIPGAYGCTEETCSFRDRHQELRALGVSRVFGLSLQSTAHQRQARSRVEPPFHFLSDEDRTLVEGLGLPTFEVDGERYLKRLTLVLLDGRVEHVFYPVFPPDEHAREVLQWLENDSAEERPMLTRIWRGRTEIRSGSWAGSTASSINRRCPRSGDPVSEDSLTKYRGFTVGFCNPGCRDDFDSNRDARPRDRAYFDAVIAELELVPEGAS